MTNALSCDSKNLSTIVEEYSLAVAVDISHVVRSIKNISQNFACKKLKYSPPDCTLNFDQVGPIYNMTCALLNLKLYPTNKLVGTVLHSLGCSCPARKKGKIRQLTEVGRKKLCTVRTILDSMTTCYQMLSSLGP